jgi:hypothetical protein
MDIFPLGGKRDSNQPTNFFHPKSEDSIGDIQIDDEIMVIFQQVENEAVQQTDLRTRRSPAWPLRII